MNFATKIKLIDTVITMSILVSSTLIGGTIVIMLLTAEDIRFNIWLNNRYMFDYVTIQLIAWFYAVNIIAGIIIVTIQNKIITR